MARLGLSRDEIALIQNTWKPVMDNIGFTSLNMVLLWFDKEPQVVQCFPLFRGKTLAELRTLPRVRAHGTHIFCALEGIIKNLDSDSTLDELLSDLRRYHVRVKEAITQPEFKKFILMMNGFLAGKLGSQYDKPTAAAYAKLLVSIGREGGLHQ